MISRRDAATGMVSAALAFVALPSRGRAATQTLRVGYQKYGNLLLLKASGLLEEKLKPLGTQVAWRQFVSGPALLEALAAGAIDYGTAGETPPVFAQAAGAPLLYYGSEPAAPKGEAILVLKDSPVKAVADLKGKKVALNKGSNVHYLLVRALAEAGLTPKDISPIYLAPPDGRAAFERGSVDAWVIWDPYMAAAQAAGRVRTLVDGTGLVSNHQFYLGSRRFTDKQVLASLHDAIAEIDARTAHDPAAAAKLLSPEMGLPEDVLAVALRRQAWGVQPMDGKLVGEQQNIADTFFKLGLIPTPIKIADALAPA